MEETIQTHRAVTEAIVQGDSVGAKCAMIMHLTYNRQMLVKMMQDVYKRQIYCPFTCNLYTGYFIMASGIIGLCKVVLM